MVDDTTLLEPHDDIPAFAVPEDLGALATQVDDLQITTDITAHEQDLDFIPVESSQEKKKRRRRRRGGRRSTQKQTGICSILSPAAYSQASSSSSASSSLSSGTSGNRWQTLQDTTQDDPQEEQDFAKAGSS